MSMFTLRPASRLANQASYTSSASIRRTPPINVLLRRSFCATVCQKDQFLDVDKATFTKVISKENSNGKIVLVDFYADWCGPCKMLSPILMKLTAPGPEGDHTVKTASGRPLDLVTVNADEQMELTMEYEISALPTVIAFKDGEQVQKFVGALPEKGVHAFISAL